MTMTTDNRPAVSVPSRIFHGIMDDVEAELTDAQREAIGRLNIEDRQWGRGHRAIISGTEDDVAVMRALLEGQLPKLSSTWADLLIHALSPGGQTSIPQRPARNSNKSSNQRHRRPAPRPQIEATGTRSNNGNHGTSVVAQAARRVVHEINVGEREITIPLGGDGPIVRITFQSE